MTFEIDAFGTVTIAMCVFFLGYAIVSRSEILRNYSIPEPVVGGIAFAIVIAIIFYVADVKINFDLFRRDFLLVYFFAALGLRSNLQELIANGRPLAVLVTLAAVFLVIQNIVGITIALAFDYDRQIGIVAGSMALIGRSGTTVAWAPIFERQFDLQHVSRLGIAVNMVGLLAACAMGGPIARLLINRYRLSAPGGSADLDVGIARDAQSPQLDYYAFLLALLRIHIAIIIGHAFRVVLEAVGVSMPLYVTSLVAGIILGNLLPRVAPKLDWPGSDQCLTLIAYVSLGLFYTMTLMSLQLWTAGEFLIFVIVVIAVQALLTFCYIYFIVFRVMGGDYEAAVISAGFAGIALGSTATTLAIMTAVAREYGRAHKAFVIVPLACGMFIDIVNSLAITLFATL
ncbi:MAG: sodium/glutamate symporter [Rhodospirillales bacterium]|nr:sodium/glutamate symporter [Rhodospirillales bacterium]